MSSTLPTLGLPWSLPFYRALNGPHPLVQSFLENNEAIRSYEITRTFNPQNSIGVAVGTALAQHCGSIDGKADQTKYIERLHLLDQICIEGQGDSYDALFLHTAPLYAGAKPWIFHFESFPSIFFPFINTGATRDLHLKEKGYFKGIENAFLSAQCRAIFSHMKSSIEVMQRVFDSDVIRRKLHYVPLGINIESPTEALRKFDTSSSLHILFTNSLHQDPGSFYLRGGHHLLRAFSTLRRRHPNLHLTILSSVPQDLGKWFQQGDLDGVRWINHRVSDDELRQLYFSHHMFALPSAGLHSFSILRAMASGCVPIISDALGYEEYLAPEEDSVMRIFGVRESVYCDHPEGWVSDDYRGFRQAILPAMVEQLEQQISDHLNPDLLRAMAMRNMFHCVRRQTVAHSHQQFEQMLRQAFL
ncbi:glycosyltransferase [Herbaspirillum camelliae]|uniref:glycosyltransferase n=1 Tax=Herbaspirillum camelliae TaxID=1892903 RepID=UPI000949D611|nr:glycosyltransferase [Herbaspirillum camelliae]